VVGKIKIRPDSLNKLGKHFGINSSLPLGPKTDNSYQLSKTLDATKIGTSVWEELNPFNHTVLTIPKFLLERGQSHNTFPDLQKKKSIIIHEVSTACSVE